MRFQILVYDDAAEKVCLNPAPVLEFESADSAIARGQRLLSVYKAHHVQVVDVDVRSAWSTGSVWCYRIEPDSVSPCRVPAYEYTAVCPGCGGAVYSGSIHPACADDAADSYQRAGY